MPIFMPELVFILMSFDLRHYLTNGFIPYVTFFLIQFPINYLPTSLLSMIFK